MSNRTEESKVEVLLEISSTLFHNPEGRTASALAERVGKINIETVRRYLDLLHKKGLVYMRGLSSHSGPHTIVWCWQTRGAQFPDDLECTIIHARQMGRVTQSGSNT